MFAKKSQWLLAAAGVAAVLFLPRAGLGQGVIQVQPVELDGLLLDFNPRALTMRTDLGDYLCDLANFDLNIPPARIEVKGEETVGYLENGMLVRFNADLKGRSTVVGEVQEVVVVNESPIVRPGLLVDGVADDDAGPDADKDAVKPYLVTGQVKSFHRGLLTVSVPDGRETKTLRVKLSKETRVKLLYSDLRFARRGDAIHLVGEMPIGSPRRQLWTTEVTITRGDDTARKNVDKLGAAGRPAAFGNIEAPKKPVGPDPFALGKAPEKEPPQDALPEPKRPTVRGIILKIN